METLSPGDDRASPASPTGSLDLRLSAHADSAYSSFSAASGGPEPRTPSPGPSPLPYLDWDYVRVVWGSPGPSPPDAGLRPASRPRPAVAARSGLRPPEGQGPLGPLSRQATPLLYALAAEAEAAARAVEPPSPPASRAAYRQRLQGAQRRVLRETSFQRKELRMSLPARLRPAAPAQSPTAHSRSASLSHPGGEAERPRWPAPSTPRPATPERLASQQRKWCFSEPGKLDHLGRAGGASRECLGEAHLTGPELTACTGRPEVQQEGPADSGSQKLALAYRPTSHSRSTSGEVLGPWGGPGGTMSVIQTVPPGAETPRLLSQTTVSSSKNLPSHHGGCEAPAPRFSPQKEPAATSPVEVRPSSTADLETCAASSQLPSLPDDEVFLEDAMLVKVTSPLGYHSPKRLSTRVGASDEQDGSALATAPAEHSLHLCPEPIRADESQQVVNCSRDVPRTTDDGTTGTANGDISAGDMPELLPPEPPAAVGSDPLKPFPTGSPRDGDSQRPHQQHGALAWAIDRPGSGPTWPNQRLEELAQELARLDPSLSDTLASQPSPEPPLGLLDGLIPVAEIWAAMRSTAGETERQASDSGSNQICFMELLPASQQEAPPVPDQLCDQALPAPHSSVQAKKAELADLLQSMLEELRAEQERLQQVADQWASSQAALEAMVGQACAPRELERFRRFMADLERVLGLLLLLGSRLARVHCALSRSGSSGDPEEHASVLQRLRLLQRQQEDAKELKDHVARRERALRELLQQALPAEHLCSYRALLAGKAAVLAQQRSLDERIRFLQDQLEAIGRDLGRCPLSPRLAWLSGTYTWDPPPSPRPLV
ncbi:protein Shroom1 [Ochotona curzoniae]|uniref:protein Shroom1 n=1 Tax=Ochotona curzoniae TaxID=130825 RepID=UPI001B34CA1E|nr:protein Shroom1 [Ochotona curzoniae]